MKGNKIDDAIESVNNEKKTEMRAITCSSWYTSMR